jgi:hypothetical protein
MNLSDIPLSESYHNCIFIIYPFVKYDTSCESFGSIGSDNDWVTISNKLSNLKGVSTNEKICIYRDLEYHISDNNVHLVLHRNNIYAGLHGNNLIKIEKLDALSNDSFPKLNYYHDEYEKKITTYKFGSIDLNLVTIMKSSMSYKHIEITFHYTKKMTDVIKKDIRLLEKHFNNNV